MYVCVYVCRCVYIYVGVYMRVYVCVQCVNVLPLGTRPMQCVLHTVH